jgi:hypothetical protein
MFGNVIAQSLRRRPLRVNADKVIASIKKVPLSATRSGGSPTTGLGYNKDLSASEFISRIQTTTDKVLGAVSDVMRPDGLRVVDTIFFDDEVSIPGPGETGGKANEGWFLTTNYPLFVSVAAQAGIRPSIYLFGADGCHHSPRLELRFYDNGYRY